MVPASEDAMFRRIHHVGIVVSDLESVGHFLQETFGLPLVRSVEVAGRPDRSRFYRLGNTDIELIEVLDPELRRSRLGNETAARIEHIALEVDGELEGALA